MKVEERRLEGAESQVKHGGRERHRGLVEELAGARYRDWSAQGAAGTLRLKITHRLEVKVCHRMEYDTYAHSSSHTCIRPSVRRRARFSATVSVLEREGALTRLKKFLKMTTTLLTAIPSAGVHT